MKRIVPISIILSCFGFWVFAQVSQIWCSKKSTVIWDAPTTNEDGTPCVDLAGFIVAVSASDADLNAGGAILTQFKIGDPALTQQHLEPLFTPLPGGPYRIWALAYDWAENESVWSDPLNVTYDPLKPNKPVKVRIK